ncbi:MAG: DUF5597 domain-containing protein [Bryobacteraceae bacterium]|jgi:hypothetical protein
MIKTSGHWISLQAAGLCALLACVASLAFAQSKPIPQLVKMGDKFTLLVDGKPFIMLGGQVGNFSAYPDRMERAQPAFRAMNLNTVEYPVYWNVIETEEGKFDFSGFDQILRGIRAQDLRAVILWFGTWKNGAMDWSPNWVKADPQRFPRVLDRGGRPIRVLSPHSKTNLEADKKAYVAMMKHLREIDEAERTVIMVQVENEPGLLGSPRDYSPESNKLFSGPAPQKLVTALKKKPGTWKEAFGREAEEAFTAYALSGYINEVARAGKEVYPLPTYVNVWNGGYGTNDNWERFDRPGESYPSGGAVSHMLDLWKANAPAIDMIASDIYHQSPITYLKILNNYRRPDNPLLIVETGSGIAARASYYAIADFSAIGFGPFGVDGGAELRPDMAAVAADFRLFKTAIPVIAEAQGTPRLKAAVEETGIGARNLIFSNYDLLVRFHPPGRMPAGTIAQPAATGPAEPSARVMVTELGPDEFLVMGFESSVEWRPVQGSDYTAAQFLQVEEGYYENGVWKRTNLGSTSQGDYAGPTVKLPAQGALMRVKLMRY